MHVTITRDECISCGTCVDVCPEFFRLNDDDNFSEILEQYRTDDNRGEGTAPPDLEEQIKEAADLCPVQIINLS